MTTGIYNVCGHLVINDTTFHDILGTPVAMLLNYLEDSGDTGSDIGSSHVEMYNSTITKIGHMSGGSDPIDYLSPDDSSERVSSVSMIYDDTQPLATSSSLTLKHNTIYDEHSHTVLSLDPSVSLKDFVVQNNAFEGLPYTFSVPNGTYEPIVATGQFTVSDNIVSPFTAESGLTLPDGTFIAAGEKVPLPQPMPNGFKTVEDFKFGPLADNGGKALIGAEGSGGHVLTYRPLLGSPLIDGAPFVGLDGDQRNQNRAQLRANMYDVGAVEVTRQEVLGEGISAEVLDAYLKAENSSQSQLFQTGSKLVILVVIATSIIFIASAVTRRKTVAQYSLHR